MRFFHIADLHIGKTIYGTSMVENGDQKFWIESFIELCREEKPDAVLIAGDVYDRSAPSGDAVMLLDHMLTELNKQEIPVFMIAGNHDSGQKLSFGSEILSKGNIHVAGIIEPEIRHFTIEDKDGNGPVTFWLMPYLFPEQVSHVLDDDTIRSYDSAVRELIAKQDIDFSARNVLIAHQNVTADGKEAERGGSESMVGGVGQIDFSAFDGFDYVALGHIHSAYPVGRQEVRYSGTPLCYHFEETRQSKKGPLLVELKEKGEAPVITLKEIRPLHKMRALSGTVEEIRNLLEVDDGKEEYVSITITDQRITPNISNHFREILISRGSILMELISTFSEFRTVSASASAKAVAEKPIEELFADLYKERRDDTPPDDDEYEIMKYVGEIVRNADTHESIDSKTVENIIEFAAKIGGGEG
ncbi:Exodeoxyribonuclease I subunit D [Lachnospiraceae bacterium]|nr:Exodeoxyribonuclease I subunit D [Lachnospiraceae bacterium]